MVVVLGRVEGEKGDGSTSVRGSSTLETKAMFRRRFYEPFFKRTAEVLSWFRRAQHGRVQLYVLYLALALIVLLVFGLK